MPITPERKAQIDALVAQQRQTTPAAPISGAPGGLTPERKAQIDALVAQQKAQSVQPEPKKNNLLTSIAKPFIKTAAAIPAVAGGVSNLIQGDVKGMRESLTKEYNFGPLGKTRAIGIDQETGQAQKTGELFKDVLGTGAEIASFTSPAGLGKTVAQKGLVAAAKPLVKGGILAGALSGGGASLSSDDNLGQTIGKTITGGLLGGATSAALPALGFALQPITKKVFPWASKALQETSLRLTPVQKQNLGFKVDEVADFLTQNKVVGTPQRRFDKVSQMYNQTESTLQYFLENTAAGRTVNKQKLLSEIEGLRDNFKFDRDSIAINRQIDSFMATIQQQFPDEIPVNVLNELKRSTYSGAYNKAGDKVLDTVEHDIGDALYRNLREAVEDLKIGNESLQEFNKKYSTLINARKLLKIAKSRKQAGLITKIVSSLASGGVGSAIGGPVGFAVGAALGPDIAERLSGGAVRSTGSVLLDQATKVKVPNVGRVLSPVAPKLFDRRK